MSNNQQPTRASIKLIFIVMLIGSAFIALIATFLPPYVDFDEDTTLLMRIVFYAAAVVSVGQAFWLKAKLTKQLPPEERDARERNSGGTVQRQ
jgi:hypothetical protein